MVAEEWPIAASAADLSVEAARGAGRGRLATVRRDFFLDPRERLSEQERALMTAMLHNLVGSIVDEIRSALPPGWAPANDDDNAELVAQLSAAGLLDRADLIALLLRRADEERITQSKKARSDQRRSRLIQSLVADDDAAVSAAAMGLILASGRRRDRLGQPCIEFDDVSVPTATALVHSVAAVLRGRWLENHDAAQADGTLSAAAAAVLARHDPARRLEACTSALVAALAAAGRLDEDLLQTAAEEGEAALLAEGLARRASIDPDIAWDYLLGGAADVLMLLRLAQSSRPFAAVLLVQLGEVLGIADPGREIARFEALPADAVESVRSTLALDPRYVAALDRLGSARAKHSD